MGKDGERRKTVIDGNKRNSRIYVGDSIVRKTDASLNKDEDIVVCLPGARNEHVTETIEQIMGHENGVSIIDTGPHRMTITSWRSITVVNQGTAINCSILLCFSANTCRPNWQISEPLLIDPV